MGIKNSFNGSVDEKHRMNKASVKGDGEAMRVLLDGGADINMDVGPGMTALIVATQHKHTDLVKLLLERSADVNLAASNSGMTPLMYAVEFHADGALAALLDCKAEVNRQTPEGETALMLACIRGEENIIRLLLEHGADYSIKRETGDTAQIYANEAGSDLNIAAMAHEIAERKAAEAEVLRQHTLRDVEESCHAGVKCDMSVKRPLQLKKRETP